jgi:hypothetical protein
VPEDDVCVILLSNVSDPLGDITKSIFAILYGKEYVLPKERIVMKLPQEKLKQYEGEYELNKDLHVIINLKDGELVATPTGQSQRSCMLKKKIFYFCDHRIYS